MTENRLRLLCGTIMLMTCFNVIAGDHDNTVCKPVFEINTKWQTFRLRPHENGFLSCTISKATFKQLIDQSLSEPRSETISYQSVFIGRLIEYPWLAQQLVQLALEHSGWDPVHGNSKDGNINSFVASLFSTPVILEQIQEPFTSHGYQITGASVEKVLVERADAISWLEINRSERVPFDAMVHFRLERQNHP